MYFFVDHSDTVYDFPRLCILPPSFDVEAYRRTNVVNDSDIGVLVVVAHHLEGILAPLIQGKREGVIRFRPGVIQSVVESVDGSTKKLVCNVLIQDLFRLYMNVDFFDRATLNANFSEDFPDDF